jgi:hypothetical protein
MSHASPIRWGILATGAIATRFVADLALLPDALVAAVGSRSLTPARDFAERHAIARSYGSWQELAADPDIDVIYVATPHTAPTRPPRQPEAGKAVLCEKPFTHDLAIGPRRDWRGRDVFLRRRCDATNPTVRRIAGRRRRRSALTHVMADFGVGTSGRPPDARTELVAARPRPRRYPVTPPNSSARRRRCRLWLSSRGHRQEH